MIALGYCLKSLGSALDHPLGYPISEPLSASIERIEHILAVILASPADSALRLQELLTKMTAVVGQLPANRHEGWPSQQLIGCNKPVTDHVPIGLSRAKDMRKQSENQLSNACSSFFATLASISKTYVLNNTGQGQKQNTEPLEESLFCESLLSQIAELRNKIMHYMATTTNGNQQNDANIDQSSSLKNDKKSKSSVRSLLTEKLKYVPLEHNQGGSSDSPQRGAIEGNWILNEMKTNAKNKQCAGLSDFGNMSQPQHNNYHSLETSNEGGIHPSQHKRCQSNRTILGEILSRPALNRESKVKQKEEACARCQIY